MNDSSIQVPLALYMHTHVTYLHANECVYQLTGIWEVPLWLWPIFCLCNSLILLTYFVFFWIDMQCLYFHFTPNKANTLFVWIRLQMSERAYICTNCNYTNSLGISFSLLLPSHQSCVSNSVQSGSAHIIDHLHFELL